MPDRYGKWNSLYVRFRRWTRSGVWDRLLHDLQRGADLRGDLDWTTHFVDATVVRAHSCAAGARGGQAGQALGRSRGGFGTKIHLRAEGHGRPMAFVLSGGERHESQYLQALHDRGRINRAGPGRPRSRPDRIVGDKGYSYPSLRRLLRARGIQTVIPTRQDQRPSPTFNLDVYRERNRVERLMARLKRHRRVAMRYDKLALIYSAWVTLACVLEWFP